MEENRLDSARAYRRQAYEFLSKARSYLDDGDLHQASEKGWGAASHMVKAVAETQRWSYDNHAGFFRLVYRIEQDTSQSTLHEWMGDANLLHTFFYLRSDQLEPDTIERCLTNVTSMVEALEPSYF